MNNDTNLLEHLLELQAKLTQVNERINRLLEVVDSLKAYSDMLAGQIYALRETVKVVHIK